MRHLSSVSLTLTLILALVLMLSLGACGTATDAENTIGSDTNVPNEKESDSASATDTGIIDDAVASEPNKIGEQDSSGDNTLLETDEPALEHREINFGELISLEFVEITIDGASSGDECDYLYSVTVVR